MYPFFLDDLPKRCLSLKNILESSFMYLLIFLSVYSLEIARSLWSRSVRPGESYLSAQRWYFSIFCPVDSLEPACCKRQMSWSVRPGESYPSAQRWYLSVFCPVDSLELACSKRRMSKYFLIASSWIFFFCPCNHLKLPIVSDLGA